MKNVRLTYLMLATLLAAGCASIEVNTYRTAGTIANTVDAAMKAWGAWVANGQATAGQIATVKDAYGKYQASMAVLNDAVSAYYASQGANQPALQVALGALQSSSDDLLNLLRAFMPKGKI